MAATIVQTTTYPGSTPVSASHVALGSIDLTGDTTYVTGGYAVTPSTYIPTGAKVIAVLVQIVGGGFVPVWDGPNNKVKLLSSNGAAPAALAEVTNGTNVSTAVIRISFLYEAYA